MSQDNRLLLVGQDLPDHDHYCSWTNSEEYRGDNIAACSDATLSSHNILVGLSYMLF
jgi:hypothetical protein